MRLIEQGRSQVRPSGGRAACSARGVLKVSCLAIAAVVLSTACAQEVGDEGHDESVESASSELTGPQRNVKYGQIRAAARAHGVASNAYLLAGIAYSETGLAHCWSEATWACQGPKSPDCGGGPVIAGAGDGPCSIQEGGLGMFQFDAGTFGATLNTYGSKVLVMDGQLEHAINYVVNMVKISAYTTDAETDTKALAWINRFDVESADQRRSPKRLRARVDPVGRQDEHGAGGRRRLTPIPAKRTLRAPIASPSVLTGKYP